MKKLYFVESVRKSDEESSALLLYIPNNINDWVTDNKDFKRYIRKELNPQSEEIVKEGEYIYNLGNMYEMANEDERVNQIHNRYNRLIRELEQKRTDEFSFSYKNITELYSYHINVGHGNHTLIVFKENGNIHIWMVDCSVSRKCHSDNIDDCISYIKDKFQLEDSIRIEAVMLTHPHYDHYSGISRYIDKNMIDKNTKVYVNLQCGYKSHNFSNLLSRLKNIGVVVIEPFIQNSCDNIKILYPDINKFDKKLSLNNKSSVYNIRFDHESYFVFPGDLETKGWDLMAAAYACFRRMTKPYFYAISHHGSITGHMRTKCICGRSKVKSIRDCLPSRTWTILMGRDKAFSGIYSQQVLSDFKGRILMSEKDIHNNPARFLEIDLISKLYNWF